ncbi:MAG: hypothetical protein M9936_00745 [Caldilinea sp.]|nr:hypothetical protein [Caldilinea sp.]MCB0059389.1 hypothetical protein [Caldilineaceae bacterium]MCB0038665.1 hypothetical protein [Caldilinea sp.]MCB0050292.1 hypothetical protein [Caldilinea sp.]MCB0069107.1 hypothetical protein [Caldilineaceae bacterium]
MRQQLAPESTTPSTIEATHAKAYQHPQIVDFGPINELTQSGFFSDRHELAADGLGGESDNGFFPNY